MSGCYRANVTDERATGRAGPVKVLFMSGYPRNREEELSGPAATAGMLGKPFSARELSEAIRRVLKRPVGPGEAPEDQRRVRP